MPVPCCAEKLLWAPGKEPDSAETELPGLITAQEEAAPRARVHVSLASAVLAALPMGEAPHKQRSCHHVGWC